jgi:MFS transporter, DHA2 family, multidrug resistance protein
VVDRRYVITVALSLFAFSLWLTSHMTPEWGFAQLFWPQAIRGLSLMLCIVPSVGIALSEFAPAELRYASGLFNLMRNLGGAIGIAVVNTWLQDNTRIQASRFGEALGGKERIADDMVADLVQRMSAVTSDPAHALLVAQGLVARLVGQQALTSAFNDVFRLMCWIFAGALVMIPFCRPSNSRAAAAVDVH